MILRDGTGPARDGPCGTRPVSPLPRTLLALATLAAFGCGAGPLAAPDGVLPRALPGPRRAAPLEFPGFTLAGDTGADLAGPEARVAFVVLFVPPPGGGGDFIDSGTGEGVAFAYRSEGGGSPDGDIYLEWGLERSSHEETSTGLAAEYRRASGGVRWSFAWGGRAELSLSAGGGYHEIVASGGRAVAGPGAYGGMGVELLLGRAASALLAARLSYFWGDEPGYSAVLSAGVGLRL